MVIVWQFHEWAVRHLHVHFSCKSEKFIRRVCLSSIFTYYIRLKQFVISCFHFVFLSVTLFMSWSFILDSSNQNTYVYHFGTDMSFPLMGSEDKYTMLSRASCQFLLHVGSHTLWRYFGDTWKKLLPLIFLWIWVSFLSLCLFKKHYLSLFPKMCFHEYRILIWTLFWIALFFLVFFFISFIHSFDILVTAPLHPCPLLTQLAPAIPTFPFSCERV